MIWFHMEANEACRACFAGSYLISFTRTGADVILEGAVTKSLCQENPDFWADQSALQASPSFFTNQCTGQGIVGPKASTLTLLKQHLQ